MSVNLHPNSQLLLCRLLCCHVMLCHVDCAMFNPRCDAARLGGGVCDRCGHGPEQPLALAWAGMGRTAFALAFLNLDMAKPRLCRCEKVATRVCKRNKRKRNGGFSFLHARDVIAICFWHLTCGHKRYFSENPTKNPV